MGKRSYCFSGRDVAARDNEYLEMLAAFTGIFSDEQLAHRLSVTSSREQFVTILIDDE